MKGHRFNLLLIALILAGLYIVGSTPVCNTSSARPDNTRECGP